jgi:hypothetical protein
MPPLILPSDLSGGGIPLRTYRNPLADELGFLLETSVRVAAAHTSARRVVLADDFRDDEAGSELLPGGGGYLYVRTGDEAGTQNRIIATSEAGYDGPRGMVTLARPFAAPLAAGTVVEVTSPLPVKRYGGVKGLDDCINEALARLPVIARITLTGSGYDQYSLEDYPWLTHEDQIVGIYDRSSGASSLYALAPSAYGFRIDGDGVARTLVTERTYSAADTVELAVAVPGDRLIYDGAQWTYAAEPGLQDENDRGAAPEHWVVAFGMVKALQFLERMVLRQGGDREARLDAVREIRDRKDTWDLTAKRIMLHEFPRAVARRTGSALAGYATTQPTTDSGWSTWP